MPDEIYGTDKPSMEALIRLIGKTPQTNRPFDADQATRLVIAYTTSGATARSGATLGKGTATPYYLAISGTDLILTTTGEADLDYYNLSTTAVAATKYLMLLQFGAVFLCNWEEC
jgi:hypothetical protein